MPEPSDTEIIRNALNRIKNSLSAQAWKACSDHYFEALHALERIEKLLRTS